VPDPLPVRGSRIVYGDVEAALGMAVTSAVQPWAAEHRSDPAAAPDLPRRSAQRGPWSMLVELTAASAEIDSGGRVVVTLNVRTTLRVREGNRYLAQTQAGCREGGLVSADSGAPVFYRCMTRVGRDLADWLAGAPLDPEETR
jgi:hypothetical protein